MDIWEKIAKSKLNNKKAPRTSIIKSKKQCIDFGHKDIVLTRQGVKICIYALQELNAHQKIIKHFTITIPTIMGYNITVSNHIQDIGKGRYILPRFGFIEYIENTIDDEYKVDVTKKTIDIYKQFV